MKMMRQAVVRLGSTSGLKQIIQTTKNDQVIVVLS